MHSGILHATVCINFEFINVEHKKSDPGVNILLSYFYKVQIQKKIYGYGNQDNVVLGKQ